MKTHYIIECEIKLPILYSLKTIVFKKEKRRKKKKYIVNFQWSMLWTTLLTLDPNNYLYTKKQICSLVQILIFDQMLKIYIIKFIDYFTVHWGESQENI